VVKTSNDHNSIVTGAADGSVTLWIVNSRKFQPHLFPPLSTGENHIFAEHHGAVIDLSYDVSLGIIASISTDNTCVLYSIQRRRYLRTLEFSSEISLKLVLVCKHPRLVFYAQHADGSHRIYLYTINGKLLEETIVPDRIEVLGVTPEVEYVYTGDTNGIARFYDPAL
jgi:WD40 repeat protein